MWVSNDLFKVNLIQEILKVSHADIDRYLTHLLQVDLKTSKILLHKNVAWTLCLTNFKIKEKLICETYLF